MRRNCTTIITLTGALFQERISAMNRRAAKRDITILEMDHTHPAWAGFITLAESLGEVEVRRITLGADHFLSSHILAAFVSHQPVGYLRFVVQKIGQDEGRPLVKFNGAILTEAKVIGFAVAPAHQSRGIGRTLQKEAMQRARALGCYQFRSRSSYHSEANHHLKISLGFGIQPSLEDDSLYFVMPLSWQISKPGDLHENHPSAL
jgi:GNAT superfamily N-acetyltransferase